MNRVLSQNYGHLPNAIEEIVLESKKFREVYDFYRFIKVKQHAERNERTDIKKDKVLSRRLREPVKFGEKMLTLAE